LGSDPKGKKGCKMAPRLIVSRVRTGGKRQQEVNFKRFLRGGGVTVNNRRTGKDWGCAGKKVQRGQDPVNSDQIVCQRMWAPPLGGGKQKKGFFGLGGGAKGKNPRGEKRGEGGKSDERTCVKQKRELPNADVVA